MHNPVAPNLWRCREIAGVLRQMQWPDKLVRQSLFCSDPKIVGNFNLVLIAICHQTQGISGTVDGQSCRGWDYLERKLNAHCRNNPTFLEMENLATLSCERLDRALAPSLSTSAFSNLEARTALINELAHHMLRFGYGSFEQLCGSLKGRCIGTDSIISFLKATKAYSDPNEKKTRLLIGLLRDAHGWRFQDAHELGAPVDYHEIRGHLRIGTVTVTDVSWRPRFQSEIISSDDDNLVRSAISKAIVAISNWLPNRDPLHVHYVLWNYFRALCRRDKPVCCKGGAISEGELDPAYVDLFQKSVAAAGCAFSPFCDSFRSQVFPIEYGYGGNYY
jgi:hypothetical protein